METKTLIKIIFFALTVGLNFLRLMPKNRTTKIISMFGTLLYGFVILKMADIAFSRSYWLGLTGAGIGVCVLLASFRDFMDLRFSARYRKEDKDR